MVSKQNLIWLTFFLTLAVTLGARAGGTKTVNMTLHLIINQSPPCTVNGANIEFGNVLTSKVGDVSYTRPIEYSLSCNNADPGDYLKLQIQGTASTINGEQVLQTSVPGLGIRLQQRENKALVPVGQTEWLNFTLGSNQGPALEAIPVKETTTLLSGGEFNASATLVVDYQ